MYDGADRRLHQWREIWLFLVLVTSMRQFNPAIERVSVQSLKPYARNARRHSKAQIKQIAASIERFGFSNPVLIADDGEIVAGHGRVAAAKLLGIEIVPTVRLSHLTEAEKRAYVIADNKLALNAGWDRELLAIELQGLVDLDFEIELTGFSLAEIDIVLDEARESASNGVDTSIEDNIPTYRHEGPAVSQAGDLWMLGRHKLFCGDAREPGAYAVLLGNEVVDLICTDPPYNVPIDGHVCGSGRIRHRNFAMGVGEMNHDQFTRFLGETLGLAAGRCRDGAIAYVFMDWRHMGELLDAGEKVFSELKNLCIWNKTNGGMGTFYRSKHELIFVFKVGTTPHVNTFGLGENGRYRTNVWEYAGVNSFREGRLDDLEQHPTVKPVDLLADAIKDCSRRGAVILDPFGGSGTTLIAAQRSGRLARLIEYDPAYCDVILRRFETVTGASPILARTGQTFEDVAARSAQFENTHNSNDIATETRASGGAR
jgi:DNA modification methylase